MKLWQKYHIPNTVDEALTLLAGYNGAAQILAGGTDLLLDIQQGNHPPVRAMIDITRIPELRAVGVEGDTLTLGAGVTHAEIVAHPALRARATCLVESCGVVGGPQVRNVATIGGNVAHALPAADGTLSLVALDAQAEVARQSGRAWYPICDLFAGPGESRVDAARELIVRFRFTLAKAGEASAFKRIMRPQGVALPILGCALWLALDGGVIRSARIAIGPVSPVPTRADEIEAWLIGKPADAATIDAAAKLARARLHPRTSKYRATAEYRAEMIELLARRALTLAAKRAQTGEVVPEIEV